MNKGEVWALQRIKKPVVLRLSVLGTTTDQDRLPVGLRLSVLAIYSSKQTNKTSIVQITMEQTRLVIAYVLSKGNLISLAQTPII